MSALAELQQRFTRHIRDPEREPVPSGIEPRRMRIYDELIYNTVEGFIAGGFPVLRSLIEEADWHALVRCFVVRHRCHTPYFLRISEEFLAFIESGEGAQWLPACAGELAHYEWVELALDVAEDEPPCFDPGADLMDRPLALSPLAWPLAYRWPVHRIGRSYRPDEPPAEPTCLVVYRDSADVVHFMEAGPPTLRLLEIVGEGADSGRTALERLATELGRPGDEALIDAGREILSDAARRGLVGVIRAAR